MANNLDDEQRRIAEKRELLKMRQGLTDDTVTDRGARDEVVELHGWKKVENFFYHYKWFVVVGLFVSFIVGYMIFQTVTAEKEDLYVLAISTTNSSGIYVKQVDIETALERYCPDFDGNGYVHVAVNCINLSTENGPSEYTDSENYKFTSELFTGDSQMYLADSGIIELINTIAGEEIQFFAVKTDEYPDAVLYDGCGLQLNTTGFKDEARWQTCPDIVGLYVREEFESMTGNTDDAMEQRRRAQIVFGNIAQNNVVNPAE